MSEIEKLYENAGVGKQKYYACKRPDYSDAFEEKLPPFTAEKQLEIEKVILTKKYRKISYYIIDDDYTITFYHDTTNNDIPPFITWAKTRENVFADLINYIWQDLTEEEKQQIKEILNG